MPVESPFESLRRLVADDLQTVDRVIRERLTSDIVLVNQVADHIISSGGKRLRPLVVVIAAHACGCRDRRHTEAAAIIEFIHTATLLHDDVVDESHLRRGRTTANSMWGNQVSVLVGDYLYSRAFEMMADLAEMRIMKVMANATNTIAEGEVLQILNTGDANTTERRYFDVIYRKTAKLFEAGTRIAGILGNVPPTAEDAVARYGKHLGIAFQLTDDALDYRANRTELGKNLGADLAQGKPTLPLIHALQHASASDQALIRQVIENGSVAELDKITAAIEATGGLEYTARLARQEADAAITALDQLPDSAHKQALRDLANFVVTRTY